jgi:hypothetical protein
MTRCVRCHRPMKHATDSGLGPVCQRMVPPSSERDLFGFDIERAAGMARARLALQLDASVCAHLSEMRKGWRAAA